MADALNRALVRWRVSRRPLSGEGVKEVGRRLGERVVGWGSVVLGALREIGDPGPMEAFRLYAGLCEDSPIPIYRRRVAVGEVMGFESYYLLGDGSLVYESPAGAPDAVELHRVSLDSPEDFLEVSPGSVEALYEEVIRDDFWDRLADRLANMGKPGYLDPWGEGEPRAWFYGEAGP